MYVTRIDARRACYRSGPRQVRMELGPQEMRKTRQVTG